MRSVYVQGLFCRKPQRHRCFRNEDSANCFKMCFQLLLYNFQATLEKIMHLILHCMHCGNICTCMANHICFEIAKFDIYVTFLVRCSWRSTRFATPMYLQFKCMLLQNWYKYSYSVFVANYIKYIYFFYLVIVIILIKLIIITKLKSILNDQYFNHCQHKLSTLNTV